VRNPGLMRRFARLVLDLTDYLGNASEDRFGDLDFRRGSVLDYPVVPGEELRNRDLSRTRSNYDVRRDSKESIISHISHVSRIRSNTVDSSLSRVRSATMTTMDTNLSNYALGRISTERRTSSPQNRSQPKRRDTLEVPAPAHRGSGPAILAEDNADDIIATPSTPDTPAIVVSSNIDKT